MDSKKNPLHLAYTRELAEIAYKRYFDDIHTFGYTEEGRDFIKSLK